MTPDFSISVEGISITELIKSRLVSMHITDEAGVISDTAVIHLDNRDSLFEIPRTGAKLNILLGYKETGIMPMGDYSSSHNNPNKVRYGFMVVGFVCQQRIVMT
ncbi:MAG: hypothetical protein ACEY3M_03800 [Wolbachia sp.]